jgi:exopolyphosphatase
LATLLLSAIVVDTGGLKAGGKGTPIDHEAAKFLLPLSTLQSSLNAEDIEGTLKSLTEELFDKKSNVSHLSNRDLLRRDYKQYQYHSAHPSIKTSITVGLSTVPVDLKDWVPGDPQALLHYMKEWDLMIHGSLTTFRKVNEKGKLKHKRQQLWILREDVSEALERQFWDSLQDSKELELETMRGFEKKLGFDHVELGKIRVKAFKQGNTYATRKVVAPLVKLTIETFLAEL